MQTKCNLTVRKAWKDEIFRDLARIAQRDRGGIPEGSICKISTGDITKLLMVRGLDGESRVIRIDEVTRNAMGIQDGVSYSFSIKSAGLWGHIWWACTVADSGARISAWIGVISVSLGLLGVLLGALGVWIAEHPR